MFHNLPRPTPNLWVTTRATPREPWARTMRHALKGHDKGVWACVVVPLQGRETVVRSPPRGVAPGCVVSAPSGRDANSATSKLRRGGKGLFARHFLPSRATNTRDSKPSLPLVNTVFNRPTAGLPASHPLMPGSWTRVVRHHMRDPEWLRWPQKSARKSSSPWRSGWPA